MHGDGTDDIAWGLVFALKLPTRVPLHGHGTKYITPHRRTWPPFSLSVSDFFAW